MPIAAGAEDLARNFYAGIIGISETPKPAHLAKRGGCWFERGDLKIHLGVESGFWPARKAHVALLVADLGELQEKLRASGYPSKEDELLEGYYRIYVDDP